MTLDLNAVMSIIANGPAAVVATVGGIRHLSTYHSSLILLLARSQLLVSFATWPISQQAWILSRWSIHCTLFIVIA